MSTQLQNKRQSRKLKFNPQLFGEVIPVVAMLMVLCLIIFPLPTVLLDVALAVNMTLSVLILALCLYVPHAFYLSTFPTLLLISTLFRLGLNIASTRQILLNGYAGEIITAFGKMVVGGNVIVGFVVFIIIAIIQFIVIAKGSDRVAEVGARFSLDAMPGKQMAIDADLRAGMLTKADAIERRKQLEQTSQFYGAMDGATKFVKGDAIAGLLIAAINVIGGILIGSFVNGNPLAETARLYTVLTVGDGLVSQIPSLLISFAAGILITRVASIDTHTSVGTDIGNQIAAQPKALITAAVGALGFAALPGFPGPAFIGIAALLGVGVLFIYRARVTGKSNAQLNQQWARRDGAPVTSSVGEAGLSSRLRVRVDEQVLNRLGASDMEKRLLALRDRFKESGVPYPGLQLVGDATLTEGRYAIDIEEVPIATGVLKSNPDAERKRMANTLASVSQGLEKLGPSHAEQLVAHASDVICLRPWHFLGIQETSYLFERLSTHFPQLVKLVAEKIPLVAQRDVLVELLKARIHIRNLRAISEGLAKGIATSNETEHLISAARSALASQISSVCRNPDGAIDIVVFNPTVEAFLRERLLMTENGSHIDLQASQHHCFAQVLQDMASIWVTHPKAVLVTGCDLRRSIEILLRSGTQFVTVLAVEEISDDIPHQIVRTIDVPSLMLDVV